ncbi:MAG: tetratricopeptide repeat protein [Pseudomonadota bacterium]
MAKIDRKKLLKEPDEFLTLSSRAIRWAKAHTRMLSISVGAVVVILAVVLGIQAYLNYRQSQGAAALAQAFGAYSEVAMGQAEPARAVEAAKGLEAVVEQYGATEAGMQARLALGDLHLRQEQYPAAEKALTALTEEPGLPPELAPLAWRGLGQALEGQKKYPEAAEAYHGARRVAGQRLAALCQLDQARALAAAGQTAQAQEILRSLVAQGQDVAVAQVARLRLVDLGVAPESLPAPAAEGQAAVPR